MQPISIWPFTYITSLHRGRVCRRVVQRPQACRRDGRRAAGRHRRERAGRSERRCRKDAEVGLGGLDVRLQEARRTHAAECPEVRRRAHDINVFVQCAGKVIAERADDGLGGRLMVEDLVLSVWKVL